jgi:hypothetical protein
MPTTELDQTMAAVVSHPDDPAAQAALLDRFLDPALTAAERQQMRAAASVPEVQVAYENRYFEGIGMDVPPTFVRQTLAALFLTRGFTGGEAAQRILDELRVYAEYHHIDLDAELEMIRNLPGARRGQRGRFALINAALFGGLVVGTVLIQTMAPESLRMVLQIGLLAVVLAGQLLALHRHLS